ncbi:MAG: hypothetical protein IT453_16000 [Planctomycetes bacterium]|nr:hypothetical protein [Planctomycetota bacterium]
MGRGVAVMLGAMRERTWLVVWMLVASACHGPREPATEPECATPTDPSAVSRATEPVALAESGSRRAALLSLDPDLVYRERRPIAADREPVFAWSLRSPMPATVTVVLWDARVRVHGNKRPGPDDGRVLISASFVLPANQDALIAAELVGRATWVLTASPSSLGAPQEWSVALEPANRPTTGVALDRRSTANGGSYLSIDGSRHDVWLYSWNGDGSAKFAERKLTPDVHRTRQINREEQAELRELIDCISSDLSKWPEPLWRLSIVVAPSEGPR